MDVSDSPHILSDDRIVTAIRAIIRQELARALDVQQKDKLLTVDEAAEMLGLAVPTVYKLVNQNKISFMKRTRRLYFSEQRLNDWLLRSQTQTDDERFGAVEKTVCKQKGGTVSVGQNLFML
ncbi:helix-turn-helix domain-containing protein [Prosthecochloris sp. SCSIO W1101]|uniref:helix-turn-helix domain-containing protein n=1 Tax=Prosthecochloris sp. SCSIO W1101 TaxID=2992242 RepID=UPI00223C8D1A|nr:helix-turn-helix domain-containing protein [Prosthecochloris sp. SCSIO W1101]UZJ40617.1 helix-turn-helix domain-containing protein [Prosthecochloris sp. SCSIO W1101]